MSNILDFEIRAPHSYVLAASGLKFKDQTFIDRTLAVKALYTYLADHNLQLEKVYDDKHDKTYVCKGDIKFYITRM